MSSSDRQPPESAATGAHPWRTAAILAAVAFGTRLFDLGVGEVAGDEIFTFERAASGGWLRINPAQYLLVWLSFLGFGETSWALRLPSMVLGSVSVPVVYLTWRRVLGNRPALFGAVLTLVSSWHLWHSQYSRFYAGVFLFGSLAYYLFFTALRRGSALRLAGSIACVVVATLFHATAVLVVVPCALFALMVVIARSPALAGMSKPTARHFLVVLLVGGVLSFIPFLRLAQLWQGQGELWGQQAFGLLLQTAKYTQIPIVVAAGFGALLLYRRQRDVGLYFLLGATVPLAIAAAASMIVNIRPDYVFASAPLVFVLAGVASAEVAGGRGRGPVGLLVLVILVSALLPEFASHYSGRRTLRLADAVAFIEARHQAGDQVLALVPGFGHYAIQSGDGAAVASLLPFPGTEFDRRVDWHGLLDGYAARPGQLRVLVSSRRARLAPELERWLFDNAALVYRSRSRRYDYSIEGYEVFEERRSSPPEEGSAPPAESAVPTAF